jgi:hypothetical protein
MDSRSWLSGLWVGDVHLGIRCAPASTIISAPALVAGADKPDHRCRYTYHQETDPHRGEARVTEQCETPAENASGSDKGYGAASYAGDCG